MFGCLHHVPVSSPGIANSQGYRPVIVGVPQRRVDLRSHGRSKLLSSHVPHVDALKLASSDAQSVIGPCLSSKPATSGATHVELLRIFPSPRLPPPSFAMFAE